jgi:hypothetical protein
MSIRNWFGLVAAGGVAAVLAGGCSSSNASGPASDAGADVMHKMLEGGGLEPDAGLTYDGTTGKSCKSDTDCVSPTGPGTNVCSSDYDGKLMTSSNLTVSAFSTPVCMIPLPPVGARTGNCDPTGPGGVDDGLPHFCDGPDVPTSPGLCFPLTLPVEAGQGRCFPLCSFTIGGGKATGCIGSNACVPTNFLRNRMTNVVTAYGICASACEKNSDCAGGMTCMTDIGLCRPTAVTRTKPLGAACSIDPASPDSINNTCMCDGDLITAAGFCSSQCVVGGNPCPNGWLCDTGIPNPIVFTSTTGGASMTVPVTMQNDGVVGVCRPPCSPAGAGAPEGGALPPPIADAATDASGDGAAPADSGPAEVPDAVTPIGAGGCPPNSSCQMQNAVGADCIPGMLTIDP